MLDQSRIAGRPDRAGHFVSLVSRDRSREQPAGFQDIDHPRPWGHQTRIIIDIGTFKCWTLWEFGTDPPSYGSVRWICTCLAR
ncbi:hypothetical protein K0M31_002357 [Melipona bicolor]|uniref:Uncharacterized protein n=1 Tax=Melipona bicolor TaxID=60889 RepID=A0AA40GHD0_9HYME|nr:hypothetical protein K0M31_002357 [Melipona bicolor]